MEINIQSLKDGTNIRMVKTLHRLTPPKIKRTWQMYLLSIHYGVIALSQTFIGNYRIKWASSYPLIPEYLKNILSVYHFSIVLNEADSLSSVRIVVVTLLSIVQMLILTNALIKLFFKGKFCNSIADIFSSGWLIWTNFLLFPITIDLLIGQLAIGIRANHLGLAWSIVDVLISIILLMVTIINNITPLFLSTVTYFKIKRELYSSRQNIAPELLFFCSSAIKLIFNQLGNGGTRNVFYPTILIISSLGSCYAGVRGSAMMYFPARLTYSLGFLFGFWADSCSLLYQGSGELISQPLYLYFAGIVSIVIIERIPKDNFNLEFLFIKSEDLKSEEEITQRLLNLSIMYERGKYFDEEQVALFGIIEDHLSDCSKVNCPLTVAARRVSADTNARGYSQMIVIAFSEFIMLEYTKAIKRFPYSIRLKIHFSSVLMHMKRLIQTASEALIFCRLSQNLSLIESLSLDCAIIEVIEQSIGIMDVNTFEEKQSLIQSQTISTKVVRDEFKQFLKKSVIEVNRFWSVLSESSPPLALVSNTWSSAGKCQSNLFEFWRLNEKVLSLNIDDLCRFGYYLISLTNRELEGKKILESARAMILQTKKERFQLEKLNANKYLGETSESIAILHFIKNRWMFYNCNQQFSVTLGYQQQRLLNTTLKKIIPMELFSSIIDKIDLVDKENVSLSSLTTALLKKGNDLAIFNLDIRKLDSFNGSRKISLRLDRERIAGGVSYFLIRSDGRILSHSRNAIYLYSKFKSVMSEDKHISELVK